MSPEEKADKIRQELEQQLEKPTLEAFLQLQKEYVPVQEEADATGIFTMEAIEQLFAKKNISVYGPTLGKLLEEAGIARKMVIRKNTMQFCWLFIAR